MIYPEPHPCYHQSYLHAIDKQMILLRLLILVVLAVATTPAMSTPRADTSAPTESAPSDPTEDDFLRSGALRGSPGLPGATSPGPVVPEPPALLPGRREVMISTYVAAYAASAKMGTRLGLSGDYRIMRVESAYMYDVFGHVFFTRELGLALGSLNRWAGMSDQRSRRVGAWWGAFGMQTLQELLNGFMPGVRLDPIDLVSNAIGAWWADGGQELQRRSPTFARFSLQYGVKSIERMFSTSPESNNMLGRYWHDYPNGRWGLGFDLGPIDRRWVTVFATYEITSWDISEMKNRFGVGIEFPLVTWVSPLIDQVPGGRSFLSLYNWFDQRFLLPVFYVQLAHFDTGPFSSRPPFQE